MDTSSDGRRAAASDGARTLSSIRMPSLGLRGVLIATALTILAVVGVEQFELIPSYSMTRTLMQKQDMPVLLPNCALLLILAALPPPAILGRWGKSMAATIPFNLAVPILLSTVVAALGTRYVAVYTPVSHDEIMAAFDSEIIATHDSDRHSGEIGARSLPLADHYDGDLNELIAVTKVVARGASMMHC